MSVFFMVLSTVGFLFTQFRIAAILPVSSLFVLFLCFFILTKDFKEKIYGRIIFTTGVSAVAALIALTV